MGVGLRISTSAEEILPLDLSTPFPLPLQLDKLGKMGDQLGDPPRFVMGQPAVGDCDCAIRLAIDMRQHNAVGIDEPVSARDRFDCPGIRKWREGMAAKTSEVAVRPYRSGHVPATATRKPERAAT